MAQLQVRAEVASYDDLIAVGSVPAARAAGKDYIMRGDVVEFGFNV